MKNLSSRIDHRSLSQLGETLVGFFLAEIRGVEDDGRFLRVALLLDDVHRCSLNWISFDAIQPDKSLNRYECVARKEEYKTLVRLLGASIFTD